MIRVNLLPQEYRKAESTPLKQFFATVGAVVLVTLAVAGYVIIHWGKLGPKELELSTITTAVETQAVQVKESKELASWLADYKAQYDKKAGELARMFEENFDKYRARVPREVAAAGPKLG